MGKPFYMWAHTSYMASSVRLPGVEFDHFKDHKRILPGFFIEMTIPSVEELRESPDQGGAAAGGGPGLTRRESADCYATLSPTPSKAIGSAEDEDTCGYSLATPSLLTGLTGPSVREDYVPRGGGGAAPDRGASAGDEGPSSDDDDDGEGEEEEEEEEEGDGALYGEITCTDLRAALDACVAADAPPASGAGPEPKPA